MKAATTPKEMIEVDALRVGMFIHLDMSWMSHPFPLGNFRIASHEQVATIRSLGLRRVRWSPEQSDLPAAPTDRPVWSRTAGGELPPTDARAGAQPDALPSAPAPLEPATEAMAEAMPEPPEALARRLHKHALAAQRHALLTCEKQFTEAARDCKHLTELVPAQPAEARAQAEQLAKALVDKMLGEHDLCIRLLADAAGDKAGVHAMNVTVISLLMGRAFGLAEAELQDLGVGAMLHDIGKIDLPERVRHREDHFSPSEARFYEEHVARGVVHARKMGLAPGAALVIAQHHEHIDGSGFPLHLAADRTTVAARIVALVNRYDNLCNPNVAARALTPHESIALLFAQGRAKFDAAILGAFIRMMGVYPAGSAVQLTDDRYALVVGVNSSRALKPRVLVHDAETPREEALVVDLETAAGLGIRRSLKPAQLPPDALEYLAPRPRVAYFFEAQAGSAEATPK
jgi:putative nucleotidyltransferase with HDIG domain